MIVTWWYRQPWRPQVRIWRALCRIRDKGWSTKFDWISDFFPPALWLYIDLIHFVYIYCLRTKDKLCSERGKFRPILSFLTLRLTPLWELRVQGPWFLGRWFFWFLTRGGYDSWNQLSVNVFTPGRVLTSCKTIQVSGDGYAPIPRLLSFSFRTISKTLTLHVPSDHLRAP